MATYYDDNYGEWHDMQDEDTREFYHATQRTNVRKKCVICGRMVNIQPQYDKCNACCEQLERGGGY
jgi:hypothetical protein